MRTIRLLLLSGLVFGCVLPNARAEQSQIDLVNYYPTSAGVPDPFHVRRLTVGAPYNATDPPSNCAIVAGSVGVKLTSPAMPLDIGPRDGTNAGGALRLLGAGTNRYAYIENDTGQLRLMTQDAVGESEKLRILNSGEVGIFQGGMGVGNPRAPLEIGPRDAANAGGQIYFAGANGGGTPWRSFYIENNTGQFRLVTPDNSGESEKLRILNTGWMGIFRGSGGGASSGVQNPRAVLEVGPVNTTTSGAQILWHGPVADTWFYLQNIRDNHATRPSDELRLILRGGGSSLTAVRINDGGKVAIGLSTTSGSFFPVTPGVAPDFRLENGDVFFADNVGYKTSSPRARLHLVDVVTTGSLAGSWMTWRMATTPISSFTTKFSARAQGNKLEVAQITPTGGIPAYLHMESGRVGFQANPIIDATGTPYPQSMSLVIKTQNLNSASPNQGGSFNGLVLIGTTSASPAGKQLYVGGDALATSPGSFQSPSTVKIKTDLVRMNPMDEQAVLAKLLELPVYHFRLKGGDYAKTNRLGVLSEEAPEELLDDSGTSIVYSKYLATLLAALKAQQLEIDSLRSEIDGLKKTAD
ncbi:MAG: hypothetical protein NC819_02340 [Candidatus Omnitrophica bacterium]|nr:hypothetical protein [Candidatus Omnitrophota bacterium]